MKLSELQEKYDALRDKPYSYIPGFVHYCGNKSAQHIILGEDHTNLASLSIVNALQSLIIPNESIVIAEAAQGAVQGTIKSYEQAWQFRNELTTWQQNALEFLVDNNVPLQIYDDAKSARIVAACKDVAGKTSRFLNANTKRDYALASTFSQRTKEYKRVIGVFGALHVLSPVLDQCLEDLAHARYVFTPSGTRAIVDDKS